LSKLLANSINLTRFNVELAEKEDFTPATLIELLNKYGFRAIDTTVDPDSLGWVTATDTAVSVFEDSGLVFVDRFLFFSMRRDVRRVPAAVLKENIKNAEAEWLAEHPNMRRVPKQVKGEIKETHQLSLMAKTIPTPTVNDVVWDTEKNEILLLANSSKIIDQFDTLFRKTFPGAHLRMATPYHYAEQAVAGGPLAELLRKQNLAGSDSVLDLIKSNNWIGQDFLLWLLTGASTCDEPTDISTWIDTKVVLAGENMEGVEKVVVSGMIATTQHPIKAALRDGKRIISATIHIRQDDEEWRLNLVGENFSISSFKTPPVEFEAGAHVDKQSEAQAAHLEKVHIIRKGTELLSALLRQFLVERLVPARWNDRMQKVDEWLQE
jgi:hypothetical protein